MIFCGIGVIMVGPTLKRMLIDIHLEHVFQNGFGVYPKIIKYDIRK